MVVVRLGPELLGIWGILKVALAFPGFFQSGLSTAIFLQTSRQPAQASRQGEPLAISLMFGLAVSAGLVLCAPSLAAFFRVPTPHVAMAITAFRISGITFIVGSMAMVFEQTLQGHRRFDIANLLNTFCSLINSIGSILLLRAGYQILALITLDLLTNCVFLGAVALCCTRVTGQLPSLGSVRRTGLISLLSEAFTQLPRAALDKVLWEVDALIIPRIFGVRQMGSYWIGQRLAYAWKGFLWAGAWPAVTEAVEDSPETAARLEQIHWMQVVLAIPVATALIYFAPEIIRLWTSQQDASAIFVLRMLTLAVLFDFFPATSMSVFFARRKVGLLSRLLLIGVLIKLPVLVIAWISQDFELLILSTTVGAAVFSVAVIFCVCGKDRARWQEMLKPALPPLLASAISMALFSQVSAPGNWAQIIGYASGYLIASFLLTILLMRFMFHKSVSDFVRLYSEPRSNSQD